MHLGRSAALRILIGVALSFGLYAMNETVTVSQPTAYAIDATPSPAPVVTPAAVLPAAPSPAQTALQQTSDQIASVSQQITQAIQDPSTSVDSKVQLINSLSAQFNQLVSIWQQQLAQVTTTQAALNAAPTPAPASPGPVCNTPVCPPQPVAVAGVQGTPTAVSKPAP